VTNVRVSERSLLNAKFERARQLYETGDLLKARAGLEELLRTAPKHADSLYLLGLIAAGTNSKQVAAELFTRAARAEPRHAGAHYCKGLALHQLGQYDAAVICLTRAISIRRDYAEAYFCRANALVQLGRLDEALKDYGSAIQSRGEYVEAYVNRGGILGQLHRLDAALEDLQRALEISPQLPQALLNHSNVLRQLGRYDAALTCYDRLISAYPDYADAYCNRAYTRLLLGDCAGGWQDHEWRLQTPRGAKFYDADRFPQRRWLGTQPLNGKTILLRGEQGLGDSIQFCRYATKVAELGARVILEVPPPLVTLLRSVAGVSQVVAPGDPLPVFDFQSPLMSLPYLLRTTLETIPGRVPYLTAEGGKVRNWSVKLQSTQTLRVGLVWSGGFRPGQPDLWPVNARRNIPVTQLAALKHPGVEFYSLQKGEPAESELIALKARGCDELQLMDLGRTLNDFSDTAAVIENMDLIITVDTSVAHLAGALAKPVWIFNRHDTCWRWLLNRRDSPWYPTAKLYRQEHPGNWNDVVLRASADLHRLASAQDRA
jgi:tetratricopeptide (TPR) repeat protein